jgi:hypothetical protein
MQRWQESYLGLREAPRELTEFELQASFTYSSTERAVIERRRDPAMKLGLAPHMGFPSLRPAVSLPTQAKDFLTPLLERVRTGVDALAAEARDGTLRVDEEIHLAPPAEEESPEVEALRAQLDHRIAEMQLPEAILAVDAQVHFSYAEQLLPSRTAPKTRAAR